MKNALEVLKIREDKKQQMIKENQEQINKELLAFEKALNKYENDISDEKAYLTVDEIIRTEEVKSLLKQNGYIIDKISNDIKVNTTRVYLDKESYNLAVRNKYTGNNLNKTWSDKDKCLNVEQGSKLKEISYISKEEIEKEAYEELTKSCEKDENTNKFKAEDWINALIYLGKLQKEYCSKR